MRLLDAALSTDAANPPMRNFEGLPVDVAVFGEPVQLQQIVLNLCTNAAQAMEDGGCIHLRAEQREVMTPFALSHGELTPARYVCLSVRDNGHGFDERAARGSSARPTQSRRAVSRPTGSLDTYQAAAPSLPGQELSQQLMRGGPSA
jgi:signal transduction histidine kinase